MNRHGWRPIFASKGFRASICAALALGASAAANAQSAQVSRPEASADQELENLIPGKVVLLREGGRLVAATGTLAYDLTGREWRFVVTDGAGAEGRFELALLPCMVSAEMIQIAESTPSAAMQYEVTGEVFVHRGANYLLPTHAPRLLGESETPAVTDESTADAAANPIASNEDSILPATAGGQSTEDIKRDLARQVGELATRGDSGGSAAAGADGALPARDANGAPAKLVREGTNIQARRGRVMRDGRGAWLVVFDADAEGGGDPPMRLMPCRLLERIERHAADHGSSAGVLISGRVFVFQGRNYLLPTAFAAPRERTKITP